MPWVRLLMNVVDDDVLDIHNFFHIEKFAQTAENKSTIKKKLSTYDENPLLKLEKHVDDYDDYTLRQIGFCAKWNLDNYCKHE